MNTNGRRPTTETEPLPDLLREAAPQPRPAFARDLEDRLMSQFQPQPNHPEESMIVLQPQIRARQPIASPRLPITLLAAVVATSLIGVVALFSRGNAPMTPGAGLAVAGQVALTATPTPLIITATPTDVPSATPFPPTAAPTWVGSSPLSSYPALNPEVVVAILWSDQLASTTGIVAGVAVDVLTTRADGENTRLADGALVVEVNRQSTMAEARTDYVALRVHLSEIEGVNAAIGAGETLTLAVRGDIARQRVVAVRADQLIDREITRAFLDECALVDVVAVLRFVDVDAEFQAIVTPMPDAAIDGVQVSRTLRGAEVILAPDDANLGWALQVDRDEDQRVLAFLSESQAPLLLVPACFE